MCADTAAAGISHLTVSQSAVPLSQDEERVPEGGAVAGERATGCEQSIEQAAPPTSPSCLAEVGDEHGTLQGTGSQARANLSLNTAITDQPEQAGSTEPAVVGMGISLLGIKRLEADIRAFYLDQGTMDFEAVTTTDVVRNWIKPMTRERACRLAETRGDIGRPMYFVSHAWNNPISQLFRRVEAFLQSASSTTCVWLDFVAVNQHNDLGALQNKEDVAAFEAVVKACTGGTIVVMPSPITQYCNPATRAWCVYEWDHTLLHHGSDGLIMSLTPQDRAAVIARLDVSKSECFKPEDKGVILEKVVKHHRSAHAFNSSLKRQLLLEPLSYKVDLKQLRRRSDGTEWRFERVQLWMEDAGSRVLCIMGGAGIGKSTISAALVVTKRSQTLPRWNEDIMYHFLTYSDQRRLDPIAIIKSLSFQLAARFEEVQAAIVSLEVATVATLTDVKTAFEMLMLTPLTTVTSQVIILIEALDEADPPEQQVQGYKGPCLACSNVIVSLILKHFKRLPPNVRFILTTRPDAVVGDIESILKRGFPGGTTFIRPEELRGEGKTEESSNVMVYNTVVKECLWGAEPAVKGGLPGLYAAYHATFESAFHTFSVQGREDVNKLLQVLMAAREPLPHSLIQQMGLHNALMALPGNGALYFVSEHHVYTLHKSLADWLSSSSCAFPVSVRAGHKDLGLALAKRRDTPSPYVLKYLLYHLARAQECAELLDACLMDWTFLERVFEAGYCALVACSLEDMDYQSVMSYDAMCWLRLWQAEIHANPACLAATALRCPIGTQIFKAAERRQKPMFVTRKVLGKSDGWLATEGLKVVSAAYTAAFDDKCETLVCEPQAPKSLPPWADQHCSKPFYILGHTGLVMSVAISPDGAQIISGSFDMTVRVWDAKKGSCRAILEGHTGIVSSVAIGPDGTQIASGSYDNTSCLWDVKSGECRFTLEGHTLSVNSVAFSPDGVQIVSGSSDSTLRVWEVKSGECRATLEGHKSDVSSVAFSPDGTQIVSGSADKTVRLWDVKSGECRATLEGHTEYVTSVAFSPDSTHIVSGSADNVVRIWDVMSGTCITTLKGHTNIVSSVAFSPDGTRIVSGSFDATARVWDVESGECLITHDHRRNLNSVVFSQEGRQIISGGWDDTVYVWDMKSCDCHITTDDYTEIVNCVALSPDGTHIVSASNKSMRLWDVKIGKCCATLDGHTEEVNRVAFSQDSTQIVSGSKDKTVRVWDVKSGECSATLEGHTSDVTSVAFSQDGAQVVSGSRDATVRVWDINSGECSATLKGHTHTVISVAFCPDGSHIVSRCHDRKVRLWSVNIGEQHATDAGN